MEILIQEQKDILQVQNELMNVLPEIANGKPYYCEIKRHHERRSLDANAYFHVLVDKIAKALKRSVYDIKTQMNLEYGTYAKDESNNKVAGFKALKDIPIGKYCRYANPIGEVVEDGKVFIKYLIRKDTHELDNKEMAQLIDGVIQEANDLGIETLTPSQLATLEGYQK